MRNLFTSYNLKERSKMKKLNMGTGSGGGVPERPSRKKQEPQRATMPAKKK
jgi:hypothetical protein